MKIFKNRSVVATFSIIFISAITLLFFNNCGKMQSTAGALKEGQLSTSSTPTPSPSPSPAPIVTPAPAPMPAPAPLPPQVIQPPVIQPPVIQPSPQPAPPPSNPTPTSYPKVGDVAKIASNFDVNTWLESRPLPGPTGDGPNGAFRFICKPSHNLYDDPIVHPKQPGVSHLHTFFGNDLADGNSTYSSLRTTGKSTCTGGPINRSAYWIPAMMDGATGKVVMPDHVVIYYKALPTIQALQIQRVKQLSVPLPPGLRMVFGYNSKNPQPWVGTSLHYWNCSGAGAVQSHEPTITARIAKGCPVGSQLGAIVASLPCWDGVNLDSPDHRSHMANDQQDGNGNALCPASHPYRVPHFQLGAWYSHNGPADLANWYLSSDRMPGMPQLEPGTSLHSDWFGAWDDNIMDRWMKGCIDGLKSCNDGNLADGFGLKWVPGFTWKAIPRLVDPPAQPTAQVLGATKQLICNP